MLYLLVTTVVKTKLITYMYSWVLVWQFEAISCVQTKDNQLTFIPSNYLQGAMKPSCHCMISKLLSLVALVVNF